MVVRASHDDVGHVSVSQRVVRRVFSSICPLPRELASGTHLRSPSRMFPPRAKESPLNARRAAPSPWLAPHTSSGLIVANRDLLLIEAEVTLA